MQARAQERSRYAAVLPGQDNASAASAPVFCCIARRVWRIALALACALPGAAGALDAEFIAKVRASVVQVRAIEASGRFVSLGSAVMIAPGTAVTACHVIAGAARIDLIAGGDSEIGELVAGDTEHDVCLVRVLRLAARAAEAAPPLAVGQAVYAVGFSGGQRLSVGEGVVIALHAFDGARVIQTDAWFGLGASGGGLFDDQGRLAGIIAFKAAATDSEVQFVLPLEWVAAAAHRRPRIDAGPFWNRAYADLPAFLREAAAAAYARQ